MIGFSEYLQNFMKSNAISMVELSKETDIDRTVIYRYVKGTRVPSDMDIVIRMADAMQMSVNEKNHLLVEYDKLTLGEPMVYSYQYIERMLQSLERLNRNSVSRRKHWQTVCELSMDEPIIELGTREEIITYILDLFQYVVARGNEFQKIILVMQPIYNEIQKFIPQIFQQSDIQIEQIICMEQNINQGHKNLDVFQGLLPLCFSLSNYNTYYYYDSLSNHINDMTIMPNILLANDYVVQFNYKMDKGLAIKNEIFAEGMYEQYRLLKKASRSLLLRSNNPNLLSDYLKELRFKMHGRFFKQFCMGYCLDREILERCIYPFPGKEKFIDELIGTIGSWQGKEWLNPNAITEEIVSYGTRSGIEEFMKTGRIEEFPEALYLPLSPKERLMVLERLIILVEAGKIRCQFISEKVEVPDKMLFYWDEKEKRLVLNKIEKREILRIIVDEQSIYRTFRLYLEYLERKGLLLGEETSLKTLVKIQKQFERGNNFV